MALNPTKSAVVLFGTSQRLKSSSGLHSFNAAGTDIKLSGKVKILGATLDSNLTPKHSPVPVFIAFVLSGKFVRT